MAYLGNLYYSLVNPGTYCDKHVSIQYIQGHIQVRTSKYILVHSSMYQVHTVENIVGRPGPVEAGQLRYPAHATMAPAKLDRAPHGARRDRKRSKMKFVNELN